MAAYVCIYVYPRLIHQLEYHCLINLTRAVRRLLAADDLFMQHSVPDTFDSFCLSPCCRSAGAQQRGLGFRSGLGFVACPDTC